MPILSKRASKMPESPIRKLMPYANKAKKEGKEIYYLNIGQPDIETPQVALNAVKKADLKVLGYTPSEGTEDLLAAIVSYYKKHKISVAIDNVITTTGASEALNFVFSSILNANDEIIIPEPYYANYNGFAVACDVKVRPVISKFEDNFALPPVAEFEKLITSKTKAILICNPGNPTGYLYTKDEIKALAEIAKKHDIFLIADEVYREFTYDGLKHYSILQEEGLEEHAIVVDSVSKRFSMCGARIGCVVSKNKSLMKSILKFAQARLSPPTYAQIAAEAAYRETEEDYFEKIIKRYSTRRDILVRELSAIEGVKVAQPKGAFYCIAELPVEDAEDFALWVLKEFSFKNQTLVVAPASGFYATEGQGKSQVRIAYVLKKERLIKAVEVLKEALKAYPNHNK